MDNIASRFGKSAIGRAALQSVSVSFARSPTTFSLISSLEFRRSRTFHRRQMPFSSTLAIALASIQMPLMSWTTRRMEEDTNSLHRPQQRHSLLILLQQLLPLNLPLALPHLSLLMRGQSPLPSTHQGAVPHLHNLTLRKASRADGEAGLAPLPPAEARGRPLLLLATVAVGTGNSSSSQERHDGGAMNLPTLTIPVPPAPHLLMATVAISPNIPPSSHKPLLVDIRGRLIRVGQEAGPQDPALPPSPHPELFPGAPQLQG